MQVTICVPDEVLGAAAARQAPLAEFIEDLIRRGLESIQPRPALATAIERIRALRSIAGSGGKP